MQAVKENTAKKANKQMKRDKRDLHLNLKMISLVCINRTHWH